MIGVYLDISKPFTPAYTDLLPYFVNFCTAKLAWLHVQ